MAIKILANSVQPTRKSPNTGGITVDTGASQFGTTVAQFGQTTRNAIKQYGTAKAEAEYSLKSTEADIAIEESIKNLQRDMLSPTNTLDPTEWSNAFLEGSEEIRLTMLGQTEDKKLQQSINASWSKHYNYYEKDIFTESTKRINNNLSIALKSGMSTSASSLANAQTLNQVSIGLTELDSYIAKFFELGMNKEGEMPQDYYETYIGEVISKRLMKESADMTPGQMRLLYTNEGVENHEILSALLKFPGLDQNAKDELIDAAILYKEERLDLSLIHI